MHEENKKRLKVLSRYLGVPKGDITPYSNSDDVIDKLFYVTADDGSVETWMVLDNEQFDSEEDSVTWNVIDSGFEHLPKAVQERILEEPERYIDIDDEYFAEEFYEHVSTSVDYFEDSGELVEMAIAYGILSDEWKDVSDDDIENEADITIDFLKEELELALQNDIKHYASYYEWYADEMDDDLEYLLGEGFVDLDSHQVEDLMHCNYRDYIYPLLAQVDGKVEHIGDYYIFRTE